MGEAAGDVSAEVGGEEPVANEIGEYERRRGERVLAEAGKNVEDVDGA